MLVKNIYSSFTKYSESIALIYKGRNYTYGQFLSLINYRTIELKKILSGDELLVTVDSTDNFEHWISTIALMFLGISSTPSIRNEGLPSIYHTRKSIGNNNDFDVKVQSYKDILSFHKEFKLDFVANQENWYRVFYSSGTTGSKKAIAINSRMIESRIDSSHYFFPNRNICLSLMPPESALGFHFHLGQWLLGGAVILDKDFSDIEKSIIGSKVNYLVCSPHQIIHFIKDLELLSYKLNFNIDEIIISGAEITEGLRKKIKRNFSSSITCLYGATETGHWSKNSITENTSLRNLGKLDKDVCLEVVDINDGDCGSLRIKTRHMVSGYMDGQSSDVFADGWFYSGDVAFTTKNDEIQLVGRTYDVLNIAGLKVGLNEIDEFVCGLDDVTDASCFWIKDELGYAELWMAVVLGDMKQLNRIFQDINIKFGENAGPKRIIPVEMIPRTYSGKPQRNLMSEKVTVQINLLKSQRN